MTLLQEVIQQLKDNGRCTVIPFKVIAYSSSGQHNWSQFDYDENFIGWLLGHWAKRSIDKTDNNISFIKEGNKINVQKNF